MLKMTEAKLIQNFKKILANNFVPEEDIITCGGNKSRLMDFNFYIKATNTLISLEAKTFNDTRTNSNLFLGLFGKMIKGRCLNNKDERYSKIPNKEYGFLFFKKDRSKLKKLLSVIDKEDWIIFCYTYSVKHVYLIDDDKYELVDALSFIDDAGNIDEYFKDAAIEEKDESEKKENRNNRKWPYRWRNERAIRKRNCL